MAAPTTTVHVFQNMGQTLENATTTFVSNIAGATITAIYPWAIAGITLYVILMGYLLIAGKLEGPFQTIMIKMVKIILVGMFALHADTYLQQIVPAFQGMESTLTTAFSTTGGGGGGGTIFTTLDDSLSKIFELIAKCSEKAQEADWYAIGTVIMWYAIATIIAIGGGIVIVVGGIAIMMSTMYLKILFSIGPFFIAGLMFPITQKFFDSWVGIVLNHILIVALVAVVLTLSVTIFNTEVTKLTVDSGTDSMLLAALQLIIICLILYAVVKGVIPLAAALAGGLSMAVMGVSGIGQRLGQIGRAAKGTAKGAAATVSGGIAAGRAIKNFAFKNRVTGGT